MYFFYIKLGANFLLSFVKRKLRNMFEETAQEGMYGADLWAGAIALHGEMSQDRFYSRRYEAMLEWRERPRLLGHANHTPEIWTERADPWVDQLLNSHTVLSCLFKVPLSAALREALQVSRCYHDSYGNV